MSKRKKPQRFYCPRCKKRVYICWQFVDGSEILRCDFCGNEFHREQQEGYYK